MWPDRPVCGKAGTRDQGANTRRNTSINESIFSEEINPIISA